jgi:hypothetical protein
MRKQLCLLALVILGAATMYGQASRTWVSGVGDDANPCSRTAPCKTFAGAISKTAPGGEIDALDPGGFGALTITKAITLDGGGGQVASILVAGTNGIVVQAGANDIVIIRNLRINGIVQSGNGGLNGIRFLAGRDLNLENDVIFGFSQNGVDIALNQATNASSHILNCVIKDVNGDAVRATNAVAPNVEVGIDRTEMAVIGNNGVEAAANSRVVVTRSLVMHAVNDGVVANASTSQATVSYSELSFNTNGIHASNGASANSYANGLSYNSTASLNNLGNTGSLVSFGSNRFVGSLSSGTISPISPQ